MYWEWNFEPQLLNKEKFIDNYVSFSKTSWLKDSATLAEIFNLFFLLLLFSFLLWTWVGWTGCQWSIQGASRPCQWSQVRGDTDEDDHGDGHNDENEDNVNDIFVGSINVTKKTIWICRFSKIRSR